jgi:uncharacterized membrane protein
MSTQAEIHDKSKANSLGKGLAAMQVLWVCVEVIVRSTRGLAISQLELVVAAFLIYAVITYCFLSVYTSKPYPTLSTCPDHRQAAFVEA